MSDFLFRQRLSAEYILEAPAQGVSSMYCIRLSARCNADIR
jgi:hypothetical protein